MKKLSTVLMSIAALCLILPENSAGQYPGSGQIPIDPLSIPKFVDPLPHFAGMRVNAKKGGRLIIEAVKTRQVALSKGTVLDNGIVGTDSEAGMANYFAYRISSNGGTTWTPPLWPAFTIEAYRGNPLKVEVRNKLNGLTYKDVNITADQTVMMSGVPLTGDPLTEPYTGPVPIALHLHGGEVPSNSDGGPHAWFTPDYELTGKGWTMGVGPVLEYPNKQEASTLWYHEHSQLGLTRINVYAGMAGFYFLRGLEEEIVRLPGWSVDDLVQEVTPQGKTADGLHTGAYLPEIEIAIQDRMFDTKGELYYTAESDNPTIHPFWSPEFFGDVITVNGKSWPYLSVAPRKYRFHFLDGSNARFYNLWLQDLSSNTPGPAFIQVGTDGGLLDQPVIIDPKAGRKLLLGPGERADLIIDFSKCTPGTVLTLMNDASAPYPDGDPVELNKNDRIMQFVVNGKMVSRVNPKFAGFDRSIVPRYLRLMPLVKLTDFAGNFKTKPDVIRQLTLNEVDGEGGPKVALLNNSRYEEMPGMFGAPTETPVEGKTEVWQLINLTMDAHPMHLHLVQFQLVSRQEFDVMKYEMDYMNSFTGVNGGMSGMYMGEEGPPFEYNKPNSDGAIGGNPAVSSYYTMPVRPANMNERGWKDVIISYPGEVTTFIVRFAPTDKALWYPKSRLIYPFDPSKGPGYVWHCHIVEHEDNDMMRPLNVSSNPLRYNIPDQLISDDKFSDNLLTGFSLTQNNPNPVTGETEFSFSIPYNCQVQLKLMNFRGEVIRIILDAEIPAGTQTIRLTTDELSPGLYFYQMTANLFNATRTMIVK